MCVLPFIQYFLIENDNKYSFPFFSFKCTTNIQVEEDNEFSPKHTYFQNECIKFLLKFAKPLEENENTDFIKDIYKGFTIDNNNIHVIFDCNGFEFENGIFATMDEMLNKHSVLNIPIEPTSYEMFYKNRELMQIKDKWGTMIHTPHVLYRCTFENNQYVNVDSTTEETISIIDDRIQHPFLGNSFIFSVKPVNLENTSLKRFAVFTLKPVYLMKDLGMIEEQEEGFTLGKVIPTVVDFISSERKESEKEEDEDVENEEDAETEEEEETETKEDVETEEEEETETKEDVETEGETETDEESEYLKTKDELREEIYELSNKTNQSIYFHEKRNNVDFTGWSVKLSTHFIEL